MLAVAFSWLEILQKNKNKKKLVKFTLYWFKFNPSPTCFQMTPTPGLHSSLSLSISYLTHLTIQINKNTN